MNEQEEFEFRARAEAEQAAQEAPKPGLFKRGLAFVGEQLNRVPAAIRGAVQGYQTNDAADAANLAWQGFINPESVQTSPEMMARFGADTSQTKPQIKTPAPGSQFNFKTMDFTPAQPETTYTSNAQELGNAYDMAAPTGLEFLPAALTRGWAAVGKTGGATAHAAAATVDALRGGTAAKDVLEGAKKGLQEYKGRQIAKVNEVLNPKLAPDAAQYKQIGQSLGFTPEEMNHPSIEYGENSVQARRNKVMAQGEGGGPYLDQHNAMTEKIQNGFDQAVHTIGQPLEPVQAGEMIRQGVMNGAKRIAQSVDLSHADVIDQFPGLQVNGKQAADLTSKLNGIEKTAKSLQLRGYTPEREAAGSALLKMVDDVKNSKMTYKQLNEAREAIGNAAFKNVGEIGRVGELQEKARDLYFSLNDALVGTVDGLDKQYPLGRGVANYKPLKQQLLESNKTLHDMFQDQGAVGNALGDAQKAPEKIFNEAILHGDSRKAQALQALLTPEEFQKVKASYVNALVKRGKDVFTYKAAKNALAQNRSVLDQLFADSPQQIGRIKEIIDLGDRIGPPLLPGSAGQLDFGGANTISKLMHKVTEPIGDVTAQIGRVRSKALPVSPRQPLNLPVYQAARALRAAAIPPTLQGQN